MLASSAVLPSSLFANTLSTQPILYDFSNDNDIKRTAHYTLTFASPYASQDYRDIPHMHYEFKHYVQTLSKGKIYVALHDEGHLGIGTDLMAAVNRGQVSAALISISNLSRALPILDILNIPFWLNSNQHYLNLIESEFWRKNVLESIEKMGRLQILFHYLVGFRTLTTTKQHTRTIKVPEDLTDTILRVPASNVLKQFYSMTQANVVDVPWANVARMAQMGHIHVLDPGIIGLNAGPNNLSHHIGTVTTLNSVPDAWVNVINSAWLNHLPNSLRHAVIEAGTLTFNQQLAKFATAYKNSTDSLTNLGATIYNPSAEERAIWHQQFGPHHADWQATKARLLGTASQFEQLVEASRTQSQHQLNSG